MNLNYYNVFSDAGYTIVSNNTALQAASDSDRLLGIFSISNMAKWYFTHEKIFQATIDDLSGSIETCTPTTSVVTRMPPIALAATQQISLV